uniref:Small VCP interacting protein n=1 Tax=Gasterosteus aculeatus aculeatus TaxID=481459 RepID=A0AAQ4RM18_GASAC
MLMVREAERCLPSYTCCFRSDRKSVNHLQVESTEIRRRQLAEAAEKRQKETTYRGVKNPEAVERKKKKQEEIEKQEMTTPASGGGGGLKWQMG